MALDSRSSVEINPGMGVPLDRILGLPIFSQSRVLAGSNGLGRMVTGVNIMEVPDIVNWVKPGQLLVTTGFAIRDNKEAQETLIPSLVQRGLAGICIKTRRYLVEVPPSMLYLADALDFPLVELPPDIGFADLIHDVLSAILQEQSAYLLQMLDAHSALMRIMIEGGGLQKIADTLATLVENTVCIVDLINDRGVYTCVDWQEAEVEALLTRVQEQLHPGEGMFLSQEDRKALVLEERTIGYFTMPLLVASECYGYICILETRRPLADSDIRILERLSVVAALEMARERSLREVEQRYANEFLNHLLSGRIEDEKLEIEHARKFGWDLTKNYVVALVWSAPPLKNRGKHLYNQEIRNRVLRELPAVMLAKGVQCLTGLRGEYLVVLVAMEEQGLNPRQVNELAKQKLRYAQEYLGWVFKGWQIRIGLGRFYPGIKGLQQSYQEAKQALRLGENIPAYQGLIAFNDLGIYRFIYARDRDQEVQNYLQETLGKLLEYDREKNTELIRTLQVFFQHHGNLKKVSEALFTHYNTILYRLERIKEISGFDLDSPEDRFNLEVALKLLSGCNK
ncbi:purine catabolism regulatory protein [Moorella thermoacetica]|uniref:Purine catabolism regulatory protein n=1 Tax=Neomoorella thermoacetica TaxID=1525 RepID=A0A1J5JIW1_NEOTH|nr:PucR family transcriptional regulator [Moorella thermoacetica]OIQ09101.1 purine catabolism regulatory protein [Moorella thermoacetica]